MSRSERLLTLLQVLRRHRRPVSANTLATEIGVSIRTLYRDIASLQAQGAAIAGEPGVGYVMKPGFMLPPKLRRKLGIAYGDPAGVVTQRVVWPFALVYFDQSRVLMCWCELRNGFRNFRTDRILQAELQPVRYPKRRQALLKEWRRTKQDAGRSILPETDSSA
jgi:predicted DNA-binding transcriptional regulator YafY